MSRVIFHRVSHPDMRLLAMYANAHNWYAAPEKFAPTVSGTIIPVSFRPVILNTIARRVISGFRLNFAVNPD